MEELYNSNKNANEDGIYTILRINENVCDLAIIKTEGDHGNTSNSRRNLDNAVIVKMLDTQAHMSLYPYSTR